MHGRNSTRDFIDVEDVASAYRSLIELDAPEERIFNVCTGVPRTIAEVARVVLALTGSRRTLEFENAKLSSDDTESLVGDASRLTRLTGWRPTRSLEESLSAMVREYGA
jgi:nucleoside-diphosphate-sugar epimerase